MLSPICKLSKLPRKPTLSLTSEFRLLSVTAANKRVISKKLVTAFAAIWTVSLPMIISEYYKVILDDTPTRKELTAFARFANAVPWRLAHRDNFAAKAPGHVNGGSAPPTLSAHTRWPLGVRVNAKPQPVFVREFRLDVTIFRHLPGLRYLDKFIVT